MAFEKQEADPEALKIAPDNVVDTKAQPDEAAKGKDGAKARKEHNDAKKHATLTELGYKHVEKSTSEQGCCLERHNGYRESSCSHTWQSRLRAERDGWRLYKGATIESGSKTKKTWFTTGKDPWPNNAHHLVPIAEIRNKIVKTAATNIQLAQHIMCDLLKSGYNVNYRTNMLTLPSAALQSVELGLPMHLEYHSTYNALVRRRLTNIFEPAYGNLIKDSNDKNKEHPAAPLPKDVSKAILALQEQIYLEITNKTAVEQRKTDYNTTEMHAKIDKYNAADAAAKAGTGTRTAAKKLLSEIKRDIHVNAFARSIPS